MHRILSFAGFYGLCLLIGTACVEPVVPDLIAPDPRLVVNCTFKPFHPISIRLTKSESIFGMRPDEAVLDAIVEIYQGNELLETLELVPNDDPESALYSTRSLCPREGKEYMVRVTAKGFPPASASSIIPEPVPISHFEAGALRATTGRANDKLRYDYRVQLRYDDPAGATNFYHLNFYQQIHDFERVGQDTIIKESRLIPVEFSSVSDGNWVRASIVGGILLQDQPFNGGITLDLGTEIDPTRQALGMVFAELRTVSKEYYLYQTSVSRQQSSPSGGLHEPVFIFNNIRDGHGIFAGYNLMSDSLSVAR